LKDPVFGTNSSPSAIEEYRAVVVEERLDVEDVVGEERVDVEDVALVRVFPSGKQSYR